MPPRAISIKVAREEDLSSHIGNDGFYFDLVDFDRVRAFQIPDNTTMSRLKEEIAVEFSIPSQFQRLWLFCKRQNGTWRPVRPFSTEENNLSMTSLHKLLSRTFLFLNPDGVKLFLEVLNDSSPQNLSNDDGLVFLKLYDPEQTQIRYIGMLFVKASSRPSDILPKLRSLAGFCADEEMELYEEIKFEPSAMCEAIDANITFSESQIGHGDIICYQKSSKSLSHHAYPSVEIFFKRIHDLKAVVPGEQRKILALEEEVARLKHQSDLQTEKANMECQRFKRERDNAVRQLNELQDQNPQIFLEFPITNLLQATENFSDLCKVGDTEYGRVYKGIIHDTTVAIKLSRSDILFQQEVSILRQGRHPSIVNCIGKCSEVSALVYEWLPNGNLQDHIVCANGSTPLSWQIRTQIIGEICSALLFLHSREPHALVHGDLRPCNIFADANFRSKICNFGMLTLFLQPGNHQPALTARLPYLDPEFLTTGELTPLSDVYSLGVIILCLLTGLPPLTIAKKVSEALENNSLHTLIDKSAGNWPYVQAKQLAVIGLSCVEMTREKRPDLLTKVWPVVEPLIRKPPAAPWPYVQSAVTGSSAPGHLICPIRMDIMKDPQVASDGFTYEAEAIRRWFDGGNNRSPMTNLPLANRDLVPNRAVLSSIQEYHEQQRQPGS
ncbi:U-box domain-containing protein 57-like isoform X1 [Triticum urartu]|uniref:RING-type E3 ubiquitin transferase n=1 Tax=Triticum urartu TaxID=4572 RepID=A0A8R7TLQ1_TRIUA|nr:U-box domain-containing protein 57-like isoform X1 [Triticum urartu]XP_048558615.1 U-box domain-containing protein 57-like isoform X1 [Triticum urartu]